MEEGGRPTFEILGRKAEKARREEMPKIENMSFFGKFKRQKASLYGHRRLDAEQRAEFTIVKSTRHGNSGRNKIRKR